MIERRALSLHAHVACAHDDAAAYPDATVCLFVAPFAHDYAMMLCLCCLMPDALRVITRLCSFFDVRAMLWRRDAPLRALSAVCWCFTFICYTWFCWCYSISLTPLRLSCSPYYVDFMPLLCHATPLLRHAEPPADYGCLSFSLFTYSDTPFFIRAAFIHHDACRHAIHISYAVWLLVASRLRLFAMPIMLIERPLSLPAPHILILFCCSLMFFFDCRRFCYAVSFVALSLSAHMPYSPDIDMFAYWCRTWYWFFRLTPYFDFAMPHTIYACWLLFIIIVAIAAADILLMLLVLLFVLLFAASMPWALFTLLPFDADMLLIIVFSCSLADIR